MRVTRSNGCVARLAPGEAKRIPHRNENPLVGYYIGCPACGRVNVVTSFEQTFIEDDEGLTMRPGIVCERPSCAKRFSIEQNEFIVTP